MKIGIISDTHIPKKAKQIPKAVLQGLKDVDLIIHAGDWQTMAVYHQLSKIAPVEGVYGNIEDEEVETFFPEKRLLTIGNYRIGVVHGHGTGKTTIERAYRAFENENLDLIIFGHSHIPLLEEYKGVLMFNPGSATDKRRQPRYSYGIIEVESELKVKHVYFDSKD
jgi:uncharacterized protein